MGTAAIQGDLWSQEAKTWAEWQELWFLPLYEAVFSKFGDIDGKRLLDVGCGSGLALVTAAARGADITGIDAAPALVEFARKRVGIKRVTVGEIEELPYADASFDFVTGFNSFQYAANRVGALVEARRVLRPDGLLAIAVWGEAAHCELAAYMGVLGRLGPPAPAGAPGPWALSSPGALETLAEEAGLKPMDANTVMITMEFPDLDTAVTALTAPGPGVRAIRHSGQEAVTQAVAEAFLPFVNKDGAVHMRNEFRYLICEA